MIKKIYFILFISLLLASCGKKGDPIYKENLWIIAFEYSIVFGAFAWEVILKRKLPVS